MSKLPDGAKEICEHFDLNNDGYITKEELRKSFEKSEMSDKEINDLIKKADANHDHKVNYKGTIIYNNNIIIVLRYVVMF